MNASTPLSSPPNPSGLCLCGCGRTTPLSKRTSREDNTVKGEHRRYILGHQLRKSPVDWVEEDRGYDTPCRVWQLAKLPKGYGFRNDGTGIVYAHREAWERENGPIPDGLQIDHLCRQTDCVNPAHLEPVTATVNIRRGAQTKLTEDKVREIRKSSESDRALAERFGVSAKNIWSVRARKSWAEVV